MVDVGVFGLCGQGELRVVPKEDRQRDLQFQPGQRRPDAEVETRAEGGERFRRA